MNKKDFGKIVRSLRDHTYLPGSNSSMTQEELSKETADIVDVTGEKIGKFTVPFISKMENGRLAKILYYEVSAIAKALRLTNLERKELHFAASQITDQEDLSMKQGEANNILNETCEAIEKIRVPAYILDVYGNVVAANGQIVNLYNLTDVLKAAADSDSIIRYHYLNIFLSDDFTKAFKTDSSLESIAPDYKIRTNIQFFNRISLRYKYKEKYKIIFEELSKNELFNYYWYACCKSKTDVDSNYIFYNYNNPYYGLLRYYAFDVAVNTNHEELYMVIYTPADKNTSDAFTKIAETSNGLHRLSKWPMPEPK